MSSGLHSKNACFSLDLNCHFWSDVSVCSPLKSQFSASPIAWLRVRRLVIVLGFGFGLGLGFGFAIDDLWVFLVFPVVVVLRIWPPWPPCVCWMICSNADGSRCVDLSNCVKGDEGYVDCWVAATWTTSVTVDEATIVIACEDLG